MPQEAEEEEEQQVGAPPWMVTYADSITLLLTFFVLLLTFSTPYEDDFGLLASGLFKGSRAPGLFPGKPEQGNIAPDGRRLMEARLDEVGAEKPPLHSESPLDELLYHYPDVDIAQLKELKGAVVIRIPLVELFGTGVELVPEGRKALNYVVKMARGRAYSIVVRAEAGKGLPPAQRRARSVLLAARVVKYLRRSPGKASEDVGLSDNVQLAWPALSEGQCEIIMLEV